MKRLITAPCLLLSALASTAQTDSRPNIIMFLVDDMGWQDTSVPFYNNERTNLNHRYHTPNMERMARLGVRFTEAYACAISSPTRCSLMSGMNAARHRVTNWTLELDQQTDAKSDVISLPQWNYNGIQPANTAGQINNSTPITSIAQVLKDNGYRTIHCGKAHFGAIDTPGENPAHLGFEVNIAGHAAGGPASYLGVDNFGHDSVGNPVSKFAIPGLRKYWGKDIFLTEALTLEALEALDKADAYGQPFFLYMSHYAIHVPINKDNRFYQKYIDNGVPEKDAAYAALVEGMDKSLGDIMDWLEETGNDRNTIIIFMSDNGGLAAASYCRDGEVHTQNAPLRSGKGSAYEGGIREPMIVKWPGTVEPGSKCDGQVIIEDFFPTILEMAGINRYETVQTVDGESFVPLLQGKDVDDDKVLVWNFPNKWDAEGPGIGATCTIRQGDWKLIYFYKDGHKELYDIASDIGEHNDLSSQQPVRVEKLSRLLGKRLREMGAQRPTFKATGLPCPWPDEI